MMSKELYEKYGENLSKTIVDQCSEQGLLDGQLLIVEELQEVWSRVAPNYMADAVPQYNDYPAVAIAWAAYFGMGMAAIWDTAWNDFKDREDLYQFLASPRGFDAMDEYVIEEMMSLSLDSLEAKQIESTLLQCAHRAMAMMRREDVEPQTVDAFHLFAYTAKAFFDLGVAIELKKLGYKYEKVIVDLPTQRVN